MLLLFFLFSPLQAATISELQLIAEESTNYLSFKITPTTNYEQIILAPEEIQALSQNQFTLAENFTFSINISNTAYLYEIDRTSNETVFSGSLNVWCGASYSDCNNCGGMPPGTFKYCNGAYPAYSYYCDSWCYTFSPKASYEKAQVGAFSRTAVSAQVQFNKFPGAFLSANESSLEQNAANASITLLLPTVAPPSQSFPLVRSYTSQNWQQMQQSDFQSYKNTLSYYYGQYAVSIGAAYAASNSLNSALSSLISNSEGAYSDYYSFYPASPPLPELRIKLQADFAGVLAPRGKPKILNLSQIAQFENGAPYYALEVQNVGASSDSFLASLSCVNSTNSSLNFPILIEPASQLALKLFVSQITSPTICTAAAFIFDAPAISDSFTTTLQPFKLPCPSEYQCCSGSEAFEGRECASEERFKQEDAYGNGYYYAQHFSCENFICSASNTSFLRRVSGNTPPPTQSYSVYSPPQYSVPISAPQNPPVATATTVPSPLPSIFSSPSPSIVSIPIKEQAIEIRIPESVSEGYHSIRVYADALPASGNLELTSPSSLHHTIVLDLGVAEALFNEPGEWDLIYRGETKSVRVLPTVTIQIIDKKPEVFAATPFIALNLSNLPLMELALLLSFFIFGFASFKRYSEKIQFTKSFENNIVRLEILNNKTDLRNLEITDIVPEGTVLSTISNPPSEVTEIIFGKHIKWKKNELRKGERMLISYSIFANNSAGPLRSAELMADIEGNKKLSVLSNSIRP
ncbi:MAG: hypothetical protein V1835_02165 [Candidatus Micrarchaeota archaeon]